MSAVLSRLTGQARRAVVGAFQEARANHDDYVGTEHLLLGLLNETHAGAGRLLGLLHADPERLQKQVRLLLRHAERAVPAARLPLTPGARRAMVGAATAAEQAGQTMIGPEHLLLGLCLETDSLAHFLLAEAGVDAETLRTALANLPPTENRDLLVQPAARAGTAPRADPTLAELKELLDETGLAPGPQGPTPSLVPSRWAAEHEVTRRHLAHTQIVLGVCVGAMVGATLGDWYLPLCLLAGAFLGALRSSWLGAVTGGWAGLTLAHYWTPGNPLAALVLVACCIVAGVFLGDWPARLLTAVRSAAAADDGEL